LDYATKLCFESQSLRKEFVNYPKLASANKLFGDAKKIKGFDRTGTIFAPSITVKFVESLRNHIIHDGVLDEHPKAYEHYEKGEVVNRFVLIPDLNSGNFAKFKNRKAFYSEERKINEELPELVSLFFKSLHTTLLEIQKGLK
jgi:hypothetical protein